MTDLQKTAQAEQTKLFDLEEQQQLAQSHVKAANQGYEDTLKFANVTLPAQQAADRATASSEVQARLKMLQDTIGVALNLTDQVGAQQVVTEAAIAATRQNPGAVEQV